jgi:hypothetical protein
MAMTEQARRQELNNGRRRIFDVAGRKIAYICECGERGCARSIVLTHAEYDERRAGARVLLAHDVAESSPR